MSLCRQRRPNTFVIQNRRKERTVLTEAGRLSAPWKGPCVSFQDLITREKNGVRGGAWSQDKKREVVSVQISSRHTKGDMGRERKIERLREKEDKLLRLDKGQNCLSALVMANTNRPLLISLYLLCLSPVFHAAWVFFFHLCLPVPLFSLLTSYLFPCSIYPFPSSIPSTS